MGIVTRMRSGKRSNPPLQSRPSSERHYLENDGDSPRATRSFGLSAHGSESGGRLTTWRTAKAMRGSLLGHRCGVR